VRLINGFADGVFDRLFTSLVHRSSDRVIDRFLVLFVDGFADGVIDCPRPCLVFWHHYGVVDIPRGGFGNESAALNLSVLVIHLVTISVSSFFHLIVNRFTYRAHAGVSSTSHWCGGYFIALCGFPASATALVADCTAIRGARGVCTGHDRTDHDGGYDPQPIHLDFSTGNNTSVARRSFSENCASAPLSRHRSPCLVPGCRSETAVLCDFLS
jgi:hypothetical protein